jgi:biotin operon repressor
MTVDREELRRLAAIETMTLEDIGRSLGVSRQRVKQLVDKLGLVRVDQRVNPYKIVHEPAPVQPWTDYPGGVKAWKSDNGRCLTAGCFEIVKTKTLCDAHATRMRENARLRHAIGKSA